MLDQVETAKLLQEYPALKRFSNRLRLIEQLIVDAAAETDPEMMKGSYETILRMQKRLYSEILLHISKEHERLFKGLEAVCYEQKESIGMLTEIIGYLINSDDDAAAPVKKERNHLQLIKNKER